MRITGMHVLSMLQRGLVGSDTIEVSSNARGCHKLDWQLQHELSNAGKNAHVTRCKARVTISAFCNLLQAKCQQLSS
jgi:hypothetical protein